MSRHRGSFQEDLSHLLQRFAHRGTPAALDDQLADAAPTKEQQQRRCRFFNLNESLFERSQN